MDNHTRSSLLSQLLPDDLEQALGLKPGDPDNRNLGLIKGLQLLTNSASGPLAAAVSEFVSGKGDLLEFTRAAVTRGKRGAAGEVAEFLTKTFDMKAETARTVAALLVRIFPSIGKLAGDMAGETDKPRRRRKTTSSAKDKPAAKKPKKRKTSASSTAKPKKPVTTASKPATKRPRRRTGEVDLGDSTSDS